MLVSDCCYPCKQTNISTDLEGKRSSKSQFSQTPKNQENASLQNPIQRLCREVQPLLRNTPAKSTPSTSTPSAVTPFCLLLGTTPSSSGLSIDPQVSVLSRSMPIAFTLPFGTLATPMSLPPPPATAQSGYGTFPMAWALGPLSARIWLGLYTFMIFFRHNSTSPPCKETGV
ncbi:unnamed protein product, partial [Vitis vinifera]